MDNTNDKLERIYPVENNSCKKEFITISIINNMTKIILFIFLLYLNFSYAQWENTNFPKFQNCWEKISAISVYKSNLYVGTCCNVGIYLSTDYGLNWESLSNNQLELIKNGDMACISSISINDQIIYAGNTYSQLFISTNSGIYWYEASIGNFDNLNEINSILIEGGKIIISKYLSGIYLSTDNGVSWNGILGNRPEGDDYYISRSLGPLGSNSIIKLGNNIYINSKLGLLFKSSDYGNNWKIIFKAPYRHTDSKLINSQRCPITVLKSYNSVLYLGTTEGEIYKSDNFGKTWEILSDDFYSHRINDIIISNKYNYLFVTTYEGIYLKYKSKLFLLKEGEISCMSIINDYLIAGGTSIQRFPLSKLEKYLIENY